MTVHQDRPLGFPRNLEKQQGRPIGQSTDMQRRAFGPVRLDPLLHELERFLHVPVLLPLGIEHRRYVGDANVVLDSGKNLLVPKPVDEALGYLLACHICFS